MKSNVTSWPMAHTLFGVIISLSLFSLSTSSFALQVGGGGGDDSDEAKVIKVYRVGDLAPPTNPKLFEGIVIPELASEGTLGAKQGPPIPVVGSYGGGNKGGGVFSLAPQVGGGGGGFGGGGLGGGGGFGGGFGGGGFGNAGVSDAYTYEHLNPLMDLIRTMVAPDEWDDTNGDNSIAAMRDLIVVTCPPRVHKGIESLLEQLRAVSVSSKTITFKAYWVFVNEDQFRQLDKGNNQVNADVLGELLKNSGGRAQLTCFDNQTAHIVSGNLKSSIESVLPVVGSRSLGGLRETIHASVLPGSDSLGTVSTQDGSFKSASKNDVGYQPIGRWTNYGSLLQVTPVIRSQEEVLVNLANITILPKVRQGLQAAGGSVGGIALDQHDFHAQQFMNSAKLAVGVPTIVGGSTVQLADSDRQLYLILEAQINE